jgi:haloalkane dehalogenase
MRRRDFIKATTQLIAASTIPTLAAAGNAVPTRLTAEAFHAERRYTDTVFGRIAYVERGTGDYALFLHGFPLNGFQWRKPMEALSTYRRCIAPDFPGLGYTEAASGQSLAPEAQRDMLAAFLNRLSIQSVDLVASDSGGQVAQLFVARYPDRVRSLLLTNSDSEFDSPPAALLPAIEMAKGGDFADQVLVPQRDDPEFTRSEQGLGGIAYSDPAHPTDEAVEYYFAPLISSAARKVQVHEFLIALERNPLIGIGPALKRFAAPVRIVWGMADTVFVPGGADHLDRAFGNSQGIRRLKDRKLFWPEEVPEILVEEALRLWR